MQYIAYSSQFDLALASLYIFYIAFIVLIMYLRNEDRREGFPLIHEYPGELKVINVRSAPKPKIWNILGVGRTVAGREERDLTGLMGKPGHVAGAPYTVLGNQLKDGVGTASWALRADEPALTYDARVPRVVPLRSVAQDGWGIDEEDPDPRGYSVVTADHVTVGTVVDLWVDMSDVLFRYMEAQVNGPTGPRRVVFPIGCGDIDRVAKQVRISALKSHHFVDAPATKNADTITLLEEDKISGYFAGGRLLADPKAAEPLL